MKVFWRPEMLNETESKLLALCLEAHAASALRPNISSIVLQQSAIGSLDYTKSLTAALSTIGGLHAPLMDTWRVIAGQMNVPAMIDQGGKVPGWGSSFAKGKPDPIWGAVDMHLSDNFKPIRDRITKVTSFLHERKKMIYPNASCFTAATGAALNMPPPLLPWLFIHGRLNTWTTLFANQLGLCVAQERN